MFRTAFRLAGFCALVTLLTAAIRPASAAPMTLHDRIACQTAIDDVRWSNLLWPESNPTPKPPLADVLPPDAVRAKVLDQLRMEAALEGLYGVLVSDAMLQAELDRMSTATRAPDQLRQLYAALDNDAARIAECVALPTLVRRKLQFHYITDRRLHGAVRGQAESDLRHASRSADGGQDIVYVKASTGKTGRTNPPRIDERRNEMSLTAQAWDTRLARLELESQRNGGVGRATLRETDDAFVHETLLGAEQDRLTVRVRRWSKVTFDDWWRAEAARWPAAPFSEAIGKRSFVLPSINERHKTWHAAKGSGDDDIWDTGAAMPSARRNHSAVWSGSEMIVWGGYNHDEGDLMSGARYSPSTDTWTLTSMSGAPSARSRHAAVWTGSRMIVFGGSFAPVPGGIYDPVSDTWAPMAASPISPNRDGFGAVWAGDEMIVWGGVSNTFLQNDGARYFPATNTWSEVSLANAPSPRQSHSAVWTGSRMIVWGGFGAMSQYKNDGKVYAPETNTWLSTAAAGAPSARSGHAAVWTGDEMLIWGGSDGALKADGKRYDPESNTWLAMSSVGAPEPRLVPAIVWSGTEMILWGGADCLEQYECDGGARYNPTSNHWSPVQTTGAPAGRHGHTAVWAKNIGEMLVWGGGGFIDHSATGARYKPASNLWTPIGGADALPSPRTDHTAVWTGTEMLVWGGNDGNGALASGGSYHADTATWTQLAISYGPRQRHSAVWSGQEMIVWGGTNGTSLSTGARYNPVLDTWSNVADDGVQARYGHTAVWLGGSMVLWGGRDGNTMLGSGARYDPAVNTWTLVSNAWAPAARYGHSAVAAGGDMLVWGGRSGTSYLDDGARYAAATNTWSALPELSAPAPRYGHTALWTGDEMIVWGGMGEGSDPRSDGARYTPGADAWTPLPPVGAPSARHRHSAVWTGEEMLVWGGANGGNLNLDTGGRYRPSSNAWNPMSTMSAPPARSLHSAVWTGKGMVVWGGEAGSGPTNGLGVYKAAVTPVVPEVFVDSFE